ncbi:MAG: 3-hydroxyacyl-ACP dehydratase FabZ [Pseudomonadota bacterium]
MSTDNSKTVDVEHILRALPHRYPFLLVDRVVDYDSKWIKAYKNVTINEPFFQGHFPGHPVMPGVLILESLAQCAGVLAYTNAGMAEDYEALFYLVKIDKARFSKLVVPGDRLDLEVDLTRTLRNMALYKCTATVDGEKAASAEILCAEQRTDS